MAQAKKLARFTIVPAGEDFRLHIEDETGEQLELTATRDQIDVALGDLLARGGDGDEVKG